MRILFSILGILVVIVGPSVIAYCFFKGLDNLMAPKDYAIIQSQPTENDRNEMAKALYEGGSLK